MCRIDSFIVKKIFSISPVVAIVLVLLLVFLGVVGYSYLPLRLFPEITMPAVDISVDYPGATAKTMKAFITNTIEDVLVNIPDINYMTSASQQGHVDIHIFMRMGVNVDTAIIAIMQKIANIRHQLPREVNDPIIRKAVVNDNPVLSFAFTSKIFSRPQTADYLRRVVKPQLESISGVANAEVLGGEYAMQLCLKPSDMAAYHLTMRDVIKRLNQQNVHSIVGEFDGAISRSITVNSELHKAAAFNHIVMKQTRHAAVYLSDIGVAKLGNKNNKISAFYNGQPAVMLFIKLTDKANLLQTVRAIKSALPNIKQQLPSFLQLHIVVDSSIYIKASINELIKTICLSILIIIGVVFLFLGDLRLTLIPLTTIFLSLMGVCFLLMIFSYSLNLLTLLAMIIAVSLVVDDAVIIVENIYRYMENGYAVLTAALKGVQELSGTIILMIFILVVIFIPIAFSGGVTGKLFIEFVGCLVGAVILSGMIALTLVPLMYSWLVTKKSLTINPIFFIKIRDYYLMLLKIAFKFKKTILCSWLVLSVSCFYCYQSIHAELSPREDAGILQVIANTPNATNAEFLTKSSAELKKIYQGIAEIQSSIYIDGIPSAHQLLSFVRLTPWNARDLTSMQLQPILQAKLNHIAGLQSVVIVPSILPGMMSVPIQFVIKSMADYRQLYDVAEQLLQIARKSGLFSSIDDDLNYDQPTLYIDIDRDAAAVLGVHIDDITQALSTALNGNKVQYFNLAERSYEVIPQIYQSARLNPQQLNHIYVAAKQNLVPLSALISLKTVAEPASLNQFQRVNAVTISGIMLPGHTLSEGLLFLQQVAKKILPNNMQCDYAGNSREFIQEGHHILWVLLSVFFLIFILLSIQFKNFREPWVILLGSFPMALIAALLPLKLGVGTLNLYTQIGMLILIGLISKHGILLVTFANIVRRQGYTNYHAIISAAEIRFRPILMTTLIVVLGALPLIFADGASRVSRFELGSMLAIGMILGTFLALFIVPIWYQLLSSDVEI